MFRLACALGLGYAAAQGDPKNGNIAKVNDPAGCADDLAQAVAAITGASNHIVQGVASCPPKVDDKDTPCAAAITLSITEFSLASERLSSAARTCANTVGTLKGGKCGEDISDTIKQFGVTSAFLIASTESCKIPEDGGSAFGCVVDVVDVVDALANAAEGIDQSVKSCQAANAPHPESMYLYQTFLETGCPKMPSPNWIQWGNWYSNSASKSVVLQEMYQFCLKAKDGSDPHTSAMCCASTSCPTAPCQVQMEWTGNYAAPKNPNVRSNNQLEESWPLSLE